MFVKVLNISERFRKTAYLWRGCYQTASICDGFEYLYKVFWKVQKILIYCEPLELCPCKVLWLFWCTHKWMFWIVVNVSNTQCFEGFEHLWRFPTVFKLILVKVLWMTANFFTYTSKHFEYLWTFLANRGCFGIFSTCEDF